MNGFNPLNPFNPWLIKSLDIDKELAGGQGERLHPLTVSRPKPAVSFGGMFRIIDFTLSNCLHSHLNRISISRNTSRMSFSGMFIRVGGICGIVRQTCENLSLVLLR